MKHTDVWDLPNTTLLLSSTYRRYADECGRCTYCKEMTSVLDCCCTGAVHYEGDIIDNGDLWAEIQDELNDYIQIMEADK